MRGPKGRGNLVRHSNLCGGIYLKFNSPFFYFKISTFYSLLSILDFLFSPPLAMEPVATFGSGFFYLTPAFCACVIQLFLIAALGGNCIFLYPPSAVPFTKYHILNTRY